MGRKTSKEDSLDKRADIYGLVLAGGKSSRMGRDKASIVFHDLPQKDHVFNLLDSFCAKVYSSISSHANPRDFKNPIVDQFDFDSPLNGILTAFQIGADNAWLSMPIDMPAIDTEVIRTLISERDKSKIATCFFDSTGKEPEPLLTIWEKRAADELRSFVREGNLSPRNYLSISDIKILPSPGGEKLRNINTQDDLRAYDA